MLFRSGLAAKGGQDPVYIVDIFDVHNPLGVMKSVLRDESQRQRYTQLPMLVKLQGSQPIIIRYTGLIAHELGI